MHKPSRPSLHLLALSGFVLMASYGIARPLSNALFLQHFGAEDMLWGMALVPVVVTLLMVPYGRLLSRLGPRTTLFWSTALSALLLLLPVLWPHAVPVFLLYVWKDAYVVLLVEQFWAHLNSTCTIEESKRYYGPILLIGGLGAVSGNQMVSQLAAPLGSWTVLLGAALFLIPFAGAMAVAMARRRTVTGDAGPQQSAPTEQGDHSGLRVLFRSPYLTAIAVIVGLGQVMAATLDVVFHQHVSQAFAGLDSRAEFEGHFWTAINSGSMVLQLLAPLVLRLLSVRWLHLLIPLTHVLAAGAVLLFPGLWSAAVAFAWFKVLDYSLFRASKEVLYVPLDFDARYRVKMVIDMVVYRTTKGVSALTLRLLRDVIARLGGGLVLVSGAAALVWTLFALKIGRDFEKLKRQEPAPPADTEDSSLC